MFVKILAFIGGMTLVGAVFGVGMLVGVKNHDKLTGRL